MMNGEAYLVLWALMKDDNNRYLINGYTVSEPDRKLSKLRPTFITSVSKDGHSVIADKCCYTLLGPMYKLAILTCYSDTENAIYLDMFQSFFTNKIPENWRILISIMHIVCKCSELKIIPKGDSIYDFTQPSFSRSNYDQRSPSYDASLKDSGFFKVPFNIMKSKVSKPRPLSHRKQKSVGSVGKSDDGDDNIITSAVKRVRKSTPIVSSNLPTCPEDISSNDRRNLKTTLKDQPTKPTRKLRKSRNSTNSVGMNENLANSVGELTENLDLSTENVQVIYDQRSPSFDASLKGSGIFKIHFDTMQSEVSKPGPSLNRKRKHVESVGQSDDGDENMITSTAKSAVKRVRKSTPIISSNLPTCSEDNSTNDRRNLKTTLQNQPKRPKKKLPKSRSSTNSVGTNGNLASPVGELVRNVPINTVNPDLSTENVQVISQISQPEPVKNPIISEPITSQIQTSHNFETTTTPTSASNNQMTGKTKSKVPRKSNQVNLYYQSAVTN